MGRSSGTLQKLFQCLADSEHQAELFQPGEALFWDDPHISRSMLAAHLNPEFDGASRMPGTIEKTIEHLISSQVLRPGDRVLDLGCGPGLYSRPLCQQGIQITGVDISQRSIDYARQNAEELGLNIDYICGDFFNLQYEETFDRVLQIYGEICTFSNNARNRLLQIIHQALKRDGLFIFDVSTRKLRRREGLRNRWYFSEGGFWREGRHIVLEEGYDYPQDDSWLNQYTVIDEGGSCKVYRIWFHDYSLQTISAVLQDNGFKVADVWNSLTGERYQEGGDWIAIVAQKA
ncbi:class I SAM-dependent methyltransferase [Sporomusa aerivorans]|uniref:class I SAM-dependent methyltransferase n=1 Tax=Sporomusa aerivorans TaxID=204936 RepID=UPI00352A5C5F